MGYGLQGEIPLSQKSVERSSNAYDQHLLSKIGGPASPPRRLGASRSREFMTLPFHSKIRTSLSSLSIGDSSLSPQDATSKWTPGPPSAAISPGTTIGGWSDYVGFRGAGHNNPTHSPMEIDQPSNAREGHAGLAGSQGIDVPSSLPSRSNRGSYDHSDFPEPDVDFPNDGLRSFRRLSARERTSSYAEGVSPLSMHGMKRRASSPPQTTAAHDSHTFHPPTGSSDTEPRRMSGFPFHPCPSPGGRYQSSHGSISSLSSASLRNGSYASSTGLSVGASSISSYERPSPGGISPTTELEHPYDKGLVSPASQTSPPTISAPQPSRYHESAEMKKSNIAARKGSTHSSCSIAKHNAPRIGRLYICDCCPKKPKKLESLEELR